MAQDPDALHDGDDSLESGSRRGYPQPNIDGPGRWSFISSENKILIFAIVALSAFFVMSAFWVDRSYRSTIEENYHHFGELLASVISVGGVERIQSTPYPKIKVQDFVDNILSVSQDVAAIEFYDTSGKLLYESHKALPADESNHLIDFSAPLREVEDGIETRTLGEVHVKLTGRSKKDILASTGWIIRVVFTGIWLLTVLAVASNTYILSKHLRTLVRAVQRLSTGDFGYKISDRDLWGELKHLADSFNDMSMRLRAYEDQNLDTITFERNKLEAILLSIADGVVVCDLSGEIIILNDSACKMLGVTGSNVLVGSNIQDYLTVDGKKCFAPPIEEFNELCKQHQNRLPEAFSHQVETPEITMKMLVSPITHATGENLGFVMILHDITKEAGVDKLKTNFISNVSHELRTPVTTIKSYVDTIYNHGDDLDEETKKEFIGTIHVETDRLKRMVNDILDFSRLEEGEYKLEMEFQDMTPIINLTVQSVKVLAENKQLNVTTAVESNLPKVLMNSDSIERVLRNLLSNAIKYTPEGGRIKVRAEMVENADVLEVSVHDTGIGIAEAHLPHIFDRFYRVENEVHTVKGTGLGLHLVQVAIEKHHGGQVFVKSQEGQGSTFGFRLPLTANVHNDVMDGEERSLAGKGK